MIKAYIRSYYGGDREKFHRRFEKGKTFLKFFHDYQIPATIVAQCWPDDLVECVKKEFPSISFDRQEKLGLAGSFNYILKNYLYNTDEDYIFLMDDDIKLVNKFGFPFIFQIWKSIENSNLKCHINFLNTAYEPYNLYYLLDNRVLNKEKFYAVPIRKATALSVFVNYSFIFNTKKHFKKEIYTIDSYKDKQLYDDWIFGKLCNLNGIAIYECPLAHANNNVMSVESVTYDKFSHEVQRNSINYITDKFAVNYRHIKNPASKKEFFISLKEPVLICANDINPQIRPQVKVDYLKSLENYRNALPYSDDREAKIKYVCGKTQLKDVRKEELLWLRTYRKKISAFTSTLPEEYAKAEKLLNITTSDFHVKNIAEDELKKMNENTMKWYIATGKGYSEIANFEKLREIVLNSQGKLNG